MIALTGELKKWAVVTDAVLGLELCVRKPGHEPLPILREQPQEPMTTSPSRARVKGRRRTARA